MSRLSIWHRLVSERILEEYGTVGTNTTRCLDNFVGKTEGWLRALGRAVRQDQDIYGVES